ncbi:MULTISPECIES: phosphotransferase [unclassified Curtobacterium]|uniref:phosphotransferase n=1 Tax=unclassified Curtobacterium TaxID=257496 RepID=UPI0037FAF39E
MSDLVDDVARATGLALRDVGPLPGGEQGGALLVEDADHTRFVVTTQHEPWKVERLLSAAPVMRDAVARGWPAAAWLRTGSLPDGGAFVLQEYLDAEPIEGLDEGTALAVVAANRLQRGIGSPGAFDDSAQLLAVLTDHPWRTSVAQRTPTGAAVVERATRLHRARGTATLPTDDVVHGDATAGNLLRDQNGAIRFVDTETVGRGTRVRDLADLYRQDAISRHPAPAAERVLEDEAVAVAGPAVFATCLAAVSIDNLAWWAEHRSPADFDQMCTRVLALLSRLSP